MRLKRGIRIRPSLGMVALTVVLMSVLPLLVYNNAFRLGWSYWLSLVLGLLVVLLSVATYMSYQSLRARYEEEWRLARKIEGERDSLREEKARREEAERNSEQARLAQEQKRGSIIHELQGADSNALAGSYFQIVGREWELVQGIEYRRRGREERFELGPTYAFASIGEPISSFALGESLTGQTIANGKSLYVDDIPADYSIIVSGLGRGVPTSILIIPYGGAEEAVWGAFELAFFRPLSEDDRMLLEALTRAYATAFIKLTRAKE